MDWTRQGFEAQQFQGWRPFGDLTHAELPKEPGVYVILTKPSSERPNFLKVSVGGTHKNESLTVEIAELELNWQSSAEVLYIGMAGSSKGLYDRLWAYARQGRGRSAGHRGGRYLWQWPQSEELLVAWRKTGFLDAHDVEDALLTLYIEEFKDRPFANLKDGNRFTPDQAREFLAGWLI